MHIKAAFGFAKAHAWSQAVSEANAGHEKILAKYFTWEYLKDPQSDASFNDISTFMDANPGWPDIPALTKHAEVALLADNPDNATLAAWFKKHPPVSSKAKLLTVKSDAQLTALIREAWVNDDYDTKTEEVILNKYNNVLKPEDHINRIDRLMWEGKNDQAKALFKLVPYNYQRLFQARLSFAEQKQRALEDLVNLPPDLKSNPGLLYERIRWQVKLGDKDAVRQLLLKTPNEIPYPEKWWNLRDRQIREALGENKVELAEELLTKHGQKPGSIQYKEAVWLSGFIQLEYLNKHEKALQTFSELYNQSDTPFGKAHAAYWCGRAADKGAKTTARSWYERASQYPTTFYGQLGAWELNNDAYISLHADEEPGAAEKQAFKKRELVQLVYALNAAHETDSASKFIYYLVEHAQTPEETLLAARLGSQIQRIDFGVRAAKKAMQNDVVSISSGWPLISVPNQTPVEKPLLLALMRQESEFYADAVSASNAYGLMQLLPGTAKEVAKKNHINYRPGQLFDPNYNMILGSYYLDKMLTKFNGSYIFAIGSYNAGPGRIQEWLETYTPPASNVHSRVDWIERVPVSETRHYIEHVLENTQVYRFILAGNRPTKLKIAEDLMR